MKAKLTFNLPEDKHEWDNAVKADAMFCVLWDVKQELRSLLKYQELTSEQYDIVEKISDKFYMILEENNVNLNK